jgi:hypothetical protein
MVESFLGIFHIWSMASEVTMNNVSAKEEAMTLWSGK